MYLFAEALKSAARCDHLSPKWRAFIAKNEMVWPQYVDTDAHVRRAFGIHAFPTYVVIDHEGIIRFQSTGMGFGSDVKLDDAIRKQVKIVAKNAPGD